MTGHAMAVGVCMLLILQSVYLVSGKKYVCTVTRDPHLKTFGGQMDSLAIPCAYFVTRLTLHNSHSVPGEPYYPQLELDVHTGNSQTSVNGRYYVSDVSIQATLMNGTDRGPNNTYFTGERLINAGRNWRFRPNETLQDRIQLNYDPVIRLATLKVVNTSLVITFRPVNRTQGNHQRLVPGISVEVEASDVIPDPSVKFPATLCSTPEDTDSIDALGERHHFVHKYMGIYAVLEHMAYSIPQGDQDPLCPSIMGKYNMCDKAKASAFSKCFGLMRSHGVVLCIERLLNLQLHASSATDACLDFYCSGGPVNCGRLQNYTTACPDMIPLVGTVPCPYLEKTPSLP